MSKLEFCYKRDVCKVRVDLIFSGYSALVRDILFDYYIVKMKGNLCGFCLGDCLCEKCLGELGVVADILDVRLRQIKGK